MQRLKGSLTAKVFLLTSVLLIVACLVTYAFISCFMPKTYSAALNRQIEKNTEVFIKELEKTTLEDSGNLFDQFVLENNVMLNVLDQQGNQVDIPSQIQLTITEDGEEIYSGSMIGVARAESQDEDTDAAILQEKAEQSGKTAEGRMSTVTIKEGVDATESEGAAYYTTAKYDAVTYTSQNFPFRFAGSDQDYELIVSGSTQPVNQAAAALRKIFPLLLAVILLISFCGAWIYSRFVTKPIVKISKISKKMSNLEFDWHCEDTRADEIGVLAASLNELSQKLSATLDELQTANASLQADIDFEREQEKKRLAFFSAVSHELKTPITIIKGQLEGMLRRVGVYKDREKYLQRSLTVANSMEGLVQEILTVSRIEGIGFALYQEKIDLSRMVERCLQEQEDLLLAKQLQLATEIEPGLWLHGDKKLLNKAVNNLVSNAIHYSPADQKVLVNVAEKDRSIVFTIENTGVHIDEQCFPYLFDAFYRVEQSRNRTTGGSGLGLYIVKMILDLHQAAYKIENTALGVRFTVAFAKECVCEDDK